MKNLEFYSSGNIDKLLFFVWILLHILFFDQLINPLFDNIRLRLKQGDLSDSFSN